VGATDSKEERRPMPGDATAADEFRPARPFMKSALAALTFRASRAELDSLDR
jgi:hypothetical protein